MKELKASQLKFQEASFAIDCGGHEFYVTFIPKKGAIHLVRVFKNKQVLISKEIETNCNKTSAINFLIDNYSPYWL